MSDSLIWATWGPIRPGSLPFPPLAGSTVKAHNKLKVHLPRFHILRNSRSISTYIRAKLNNSNSRVRLNILKEHEDRKVCIYFEKWDGQICTKSINFTLINSKCSLTKSEVSQLIFVIILLLLAPWGWSSSLSLVQLGDDGLDDVIFEPLDLLVDDLHELLQTENILK